jgi:hypothetical protein
MVEASKIKENMEVKGSDGKHLGTVDCTEGQRVKLASCGMLHYIELETVDSIEDGTVWLTETAEDAMRTWH